METFAGKTLRPEDYVETAIDTEDFGAVLFRMGDRTRGAFTASQLSSGRKNRLNIEIYGTKCGVSWDQERPDELWIGNRNANNQIIIKDPSLLKEKARSYADLPGGHSEGYDDTFKQVFRRFYKSINDPAMAPEYPQFVDGLRQLNILEAELKSNESRAVGGRPRIPGGNRISRVRRPGPGEGTVPRPLVLSARLYDRSVMFPRALCLLSAGLLMAQTAADPAATAKKAFDLLLGEKYAELPPLFTPDMQKAYPAAELAKIGERIKSFGASAKSTRP